MRNCLLLVFAALISGCSAGLVQDAAVKNRAAYAIAEIPTPVLNVPDFRDVFGGADGKTLRLDKEGLIAEMEFVALPGTAFEVQKIIKKDQTTIYKVTTSEYPYPVDCYIDSRFVKTTNHKPPETIKKLPDKNIVIQNLLSAVDSRYIWGGNYKDGVPQMLDFYKPSGTINDDTKEQWMLKGLDCSGLLYQATNRFTARNSSRLVYFGRPVKIAGLSAKQIIEQLEPLDIIVWSGHVIVVLDKERVIESRLEGVKIRRLDDTLNEVMQQFTGLDDYDDQVEPDRKKFVVRRFY